MKVYFNDLSSGDADKRLVDHFDEVERFYDLLQHLRTTYSVNVVILTGKFESVRLCDTKVAECFFNENIDHDRRGWLQQLANYFKNDELLDANLKFLHKITGMESVLLGNAHNNGLPAISFTFQDCFCTSEIEGKREGKQVKIGNLYDKAVLDAAVAFPDILVSRQQCKGYIPYEDPFWNKEATAAYHETIKAKLNSIKAHPENKISILSQCADIIARLNGWELDEQLTKLNSRMSRKIRRIYKPAKFGNRSAYLSVDFEKPEIYFELCDKRGTHLGEYRWDGEPNKEADPKGSHNIEVK